ncbi:LptF/LptG family permease [Rubrivirga sp.]|uniref:LptF/LptG family permease n=1 Tax=Rubrivirga sp. TaxID=1885344 RepID=UPI003B52ABDA
MTRFDWHVLRRFLSGTALLLALLVATFVVLDLAERIDDFLDRGATTAQIFGEYYLYYVPDIVRLTSPLALFLAAVYVTARLAQSMQLTAIHMAGVSTWRVMRPFVIVGLAATAAMLAFNGFVVPRANAVVHEFQNRYYRDAPEGGGGSEIVRQTAPGEVLTARYVDRERAQAFRVSVVALADGGGVARRLDAAQMTYVDSLATWRAVDVAVRTFAADGAETYAYHAELDTALAVRPRDLAQSERDAERLTVVEARDYVASLERAGVTERGRPLVAYHAKFAYPFANLILVLLAVPLAARRRRGGQAAQLALGLGVAFLYLALQKTIEPLGYVQTIPPVVAAWLPHLVFAAVALALLARSSR